MAFVLQPDMVFSGGGSRVDPLHHSDIIEHAAFEDSCLMQTHKAIVNHFAGAI